MLLRLFKSHGQLTSLPAGMRIRRAVCASELRSAYECVHRTYFESGIEPSRATGLRVRPYELSPDTATFVASESGQILATTSLIPDSVGLGLPADRPFGDVLARIRAEGRRVCELSNHSVSRLARSTPCTSELFRCNVAQALHLGCTDVVSCVSPQATTALRFVGFRVIGEVRDYGGEVDDRVAFLHWDLGGQVVRWLAAAHGLDPVERFFRRYCVLHNPYRQSVERWELQAQRAFKDPHALAEIFRVCAPAIAGFDRSAMTALKLRLGSQRSAILAEVASGFARSRGDGSRPGAGARASSSNAKHGFDKISNRQLQARGAAG